MSIKDTLTNNSMDSFAFQGKTYTRRVDNGAVVYDISAGTDGSAFSTGWVNTDGTTAVADGATLTFNHNLGTTDLVFNVYVADDAIGTNAFRAGDAQDAGFNTAYGASIQSITASNFVLQLGSGGTHGGAMTMNSSGDKSFLDYAGKYVKVVASAAKMGSTNLLASGSGGSGGYIDQQLFTTSGSSNNPQPYNGAFPNFDPNTQHIFAFSFSVSSANFLPFYELIPDGTARLVSDGARVALNPDGTYTATDSSYSNNYSVRLVRFGKGGGSGGGGGASVTTDETAPTNPSDGDLWYDENSAALYVYTDSIGGWIQANGGGGGGSGPRAYVVFDGRSTDLTNSITSSFNVSSINDVSTGVYEVNLTSTINNPILVSSWQGEYRPAYGDVTSSAIKTIALPYDTTTGLGATSTNKIYVGVNQPQNGVAQDRPIHLLVF